MLTLPYRQMPVDPSLSPSAGTDCGSNGTLMLELDGHRLKCLYSNLYPTKPVLYSSCIHQWSRDHTVQQIVTDDRGCKDTVLQPSPYYLLQLLATPHRRLYRYKHQYRTHRQLYTQRRNNRSELQLDHHRSLRNGRTHQQPCCT